MNNTLKYFLSTRWRLVNDDLIINKLENRELSLFLSATLSFSTSVSSRLYKAVSCMVVVFTFYVLTSFFSFGSFLVGFGSLFDLLWSSIYLFVGFSFLLSGFRILSIIFGRFFHKKIKFNNKYKLK